jgi:hypothetical protein
MGFIVYSAEGFVDMLREQIRDVQQMQRSVAWINFVHEQLRADPAGPAAKRRRELVLAMPQSGSLRSAQLRRLTPELAEMYAGKADKTLTRDLNHLINAGLIRRTAHGYQACIDVMDAFLL